MREILICENLSHVWRLSSFETYIMPGEDAPDIHVYKELDIKDKIFITNRENKSTTSLQLSSKLINLNIVESHVYKSHIEIKFSNDETFKINIPISFQREE